ARPRGLVSPSRALTERGSFIYVGIPCLASGGLPARRGRAYKTSTTTRGTTMSQARLVAGLLAAATAFGGIAALAQEPAENMSFFVTSRNPGNGGNLGGLEGADAHCQALAEAVGAGG